MARQWRPAFCGELKLKRVERLIEGEMRWLDEILGRGESVYVASSLSFPPFFWMLTAGKPLLSPTMSYLC